jgi:hypothetical protein
MSGIAHVTEAYRSRPRLTDDIAKPLHTNIGVGFAYLALILSFAFTGAIVVGVIH